GPKGAPGVAVDRPFSVVTFLALDGVDAKTATPDQGEVHCALEAVTRWLPDWKINTLPPLANQCAVIRSAPKSHVCYVTSTGLAVWYPAPATAKTVRHTLGCYHRNQVFATLQIESIDEMLKVLDDIASNGPLSSAQEISAKLGAGIVGRLYGGTDTTYRSG